MFSISDNETSLSYNDFVTKRMIASYQGVPGRLPLLDNDLLKNLHGFQRHLQRQCAMHYRYTIMKLLFIVIASFIVIP